ncbi:MAG: NTP transferase domain-containing protein [Clostridiales bacterium]|nr:NTP transferase domain-containing protein [Roseburia sp.]MDD7636662.1 NTP transferase domain-containing protein [Clostridiales bacterium]MDY4114259.1 NTP transferase domain-containing protein [Roseburia sp.]
MKALILNSGLGSRMGKYTASSPKCMVELTDGETIVARQLRLISRMGISEVVMTTGPYEELLKDHIKELGLPLQIEFVNNPQYNETNYIYSIYLARELLHDEILLMHGDLVFEEKVLEQVMKSKVDCMAVSSALELPEKDFKAVLKDGLIKAVGIEFMESAVAAQPLYHFGKKAWGIWLDRIATFCESGEVSCYAENALNQVTNQIKLYPYDFGEMLCQEVDKEEDLIAVRSILK